MSLCNRSSGFAHAAADFQDQRIVVSECLDRIEHLIGVIGNFIQWKQFFQRFFLGVADVPAGACRSCGYDVFSVLRFVRESAVLLTCERVLNKSEAQF